MADEFLNYIANVEDRFTRPLQSLSAQLVEVGEIADLVDPIEIEVDVDGIGKAVTELETLEATVGELETLEATVGDEKHLFDKDLNLTDEEAMGVADFFNPKSAFRQTPGIGADGGGQAATADGGGLDILDRNDLRILREELGDAFDPEGMINRQATPADLFGVGNADESIVQVTRGGEGALMRGNLVDFIDTEGLSEALFDADMDVGDVDLDFLRNRDLLDLPEDRTFLDRLRDMNLQMRHFYDILATMLPLLFVFVGAIPAVITALGTLAIAAVGAAGALAAIGGLAALGAGIGPSGEFSLENLRESIEGVREDFMDAFGPLARRLEPMFTRGLRGLEDFFDELGERGDVLLDFRDDAEAFGGFVLDYVPDALAALVRFSDAAGGMLGALATFVEDTDFLGAFARETAEMLPTLAGLGAILVSILPGILDLSQGFLYVATTTLLALGALGELIHTFVTLNGLLPISGEMVGALVAGVLTLITVGAVAGKVYGAWATLMGGPFVGSIGSAITALKGLTLAEIKASIATMTLTQAIRALLAATGIGLLIVTVGTLANEFMSASKNIDAATKSLKRFGRTNSRVDGLGMGGMGRHSANGGYVDYTDASTTVIEAPDTETGKKTARYNDYKQGTMDDQYFS